MKRITCFFILLWPIVLTAQQIPDRSIFAETAFLWNPAMTGAFPWWELSTSYRQQWLGFDNAPRCQGVGIRGGMGADHTDNARRVLQSQLGRNG